MANPFSFNLHSHTARCGHAGGEDEEYVLAAMEAGFSVLGFSDHIMLPGLSQKRIRGDYSELPGYIASVKELRERYKDKIEIHLGFEAEWYGDRFASYYNELLSSDFEYLILGQHCYLEGDSFRWYWHIPGEHERMKRYTDDLIAGMESGLFLYVAHPDLFMPIHVDEFVENEMRRICLASVRLGVPLELNMGPSRREGGIEAMDYPSDAFWKIAGEEGVTAVVGVDAHNPHDYAISNYVFFEEFAKKHGVKLLTVCPDFPRKKGLFC